MTILIVGCGYVGSRLLSLLSSENEKVYGLRRSPDTRTSSVMLRADVTEPESLRELPADISDVVYCVSPDSRRDEDYRLAYPVGVRHLIQRYPKARMVFVSSTAVYGQSEGATVDDHSPADASHFRAERLREAEDLVRMSGDHHTIFRASGIYGPGRTRLLSRLLHEELDGAEKDLWTNRIHVDDLAGCIQWALSSPRRSGTYIASDAEPARLQDIQDFVRSIPGAFEHIAAPAQSSASRKRQNRRVLATRLANAGYQYRFESYRQGYTELIAAL